jgi:hypothetical protein
MNSIYEFVKNARDEYFNRTIEVVPGYKLSQYETLRTIELYHNSRFKSGQQDSLNREKPFLQHLQISRERRGARHRPRHQGRRYRSRRR